jgi:hypothetical protein
LGKRQKPLLQRHGEIPALARRRNSRGLMGGQLPTDLMRKNFLPAAVTVNCLRE